MSYEVSLKKQSLFFLILFLIVISVVEIIANFWWISQIKCEFQESEIFKNFDLEKRNQMCMELYDIKTIGNENLPNQNLDSININSYGFRGPEITIEKPSSMYRIFLIGGSTIFGMGSTNDNTTIPGYLQKFMSNVETDKTIEVINAGIQKANSKTELLLLENKILKFNPDLVIVYDGWNDLREEFDADLTLKNWNTICEIAEKQGFESIIIQQPIAGFSKKELTMEESSYVKNGLDYKKGLLINQIPKYDKISEEMTNLKSCNKSINLRNIFDDYNEGIYWDQGHISDKGNFIVAKSIFNYILPNIDYSNIKSNNINFENSINEENKLKSEFSILEILSNYKTPLMINSILSISNNFESDSTFKIILKSKEQTYNNNLISIQMEISTIENNEYLIEIETKKDSDEYSFKNVTYFLTIEKDGKDVFREHFLSLDEILKIHILPNDTDEIFVSGPRNYEFNALNDDLGKSISIAGPIFNDNNDYNFIFDIRSLDNTENWIFNLEDFKINYTNSYSIEKDYQGNLIDPYEIDSKPNIIDNLDYIEIIKPNIKNQKLEYLVYDWKNKKLSDDEFLKMITYEINSEPRSLENANFELPLWLKNNAGSIAKEITLKNDEFISNYNYVKDEIFPCYKNNEGVVTSDCWDYKLNSDGLRSHEIIIPKPLDMYRIITIGGSTTFGGETNETTWSGYLEKYLNEFEKDRKIEVINAGKPSIDSNHELNYLINNIEKLDPDLIIMYDGWNDSLKNDYNSTIENWKAVCELGNERDIPTYIIIQPLPTVGDRVLTKQEINSIHTPSFSSPKDYESISNNYIAKFDELENQCYRTLDFRWVFDYVLIPVYYDGGHVTNSGNKIIAENIFVQLSKDIFREEYTLKYINITSEKKLDELSLYAVSSDFSNKNFSGLKIDNAIFDKSVFLDANFNNSSLLNSRFVFADLTNADLSGADLTNSKLQQTKIDDKWKKCKNNKDLFKELGEFPFDDSLKSWLISQC